MVKTLENGFSIPPFLSKCYEMVEDDSTDALISWTSTNDSFVIWDATKFSADLLPKYFKHGNFSSFVRQLNIYGFRKIDTDRWEFANEEFIRGHKDLLKNIIRRKHPPGVVQRKSSQTKDIDISACEETKTMNLLKEVDVLKTAKNALMQELVKLGQHQKTSQTKLLLLKDQLKGMEKNQQQMLSFIVMAMQSPGIMVQLLQPKDGNWLVTEPGKNILKQVSDDCETLPSERMLIEYQPPEYEAPQPAEMPTSNPEDSLTLDLFSDEVRDLFMNIDFMPGPLDNKLFSTEFPEPIIIPDLHDDEDMLEQLLLTSPVSENHESVELYIEDPAESGMVVDSVSKEQMKEFADHNYF